MPNFINNQFSETMIFGLANHYPLEMKNMLPELDHLLKYHHEPVIQAFVRNLNMPESQAKELFQDMLIYLWISTKHALDKKANPDDPALDFSFVMHEEMRQIDEMWHQFILYTRSYSDFCQHYFGQFIHHEPDIALGSAPEEKQFSEDMEKYLLYIIDNLGEEILYRWFGQHLSNQDAA